MVRPGEAEAVRHDDEQPMLVDELDLGVEEARVLPRFAPERGDCAEVIGARDQRDANLVTRSVRRREESGERLLLLLRDVHVEREEDLLSVEVVAGGIAVGVCIRGAQACRGEHEEEEALHPEVRSTRSTRNGGARGGVIENERPQWPALTSAGAPRV